MRLKEIHPIEERYTQSIAFLGENTSQNTARSSGRFRRTSMWMVNGGRRRGTRRCQEKRMTVGIRKLRTIMVIPPPPRAPLSPPLTFTPSPGTLRSPNSASKLVNIGSVHTSHHLPRISPAFVNTSINTSTYSLRF